MEKNHDEHDHGHAEHTEAPVTDTETTTELIPEIQETVGHDDHAHSGIDGLLEVMFGFEHVVSEFFWNAVFILATFLITKAIAFRKIHKYIDDKHGVEHEKNGY
jgi:hypothetical protein